MSLGDLDERRLEVAICMAIASAASRTVKPEVDGDLVVSGDGPYAIDRQQARRYLSERDSTFI